LAFVSYQEKLPKKQRNDLLPLQIFLHKQHKIERQKLVKSLTSKRYQQLKDNWPVFLKNEKNNAVDIHRISIERYAAQTIWKTYRQVMKSGNAITKKSPADAYHELRKNGKKLRYLLEFFQSLYPRKKCRS